MVFPLMFFAQTQVNVNGKIVDTKGEPIIGANVIELGNRTNGTVSDIDGNFTLSVKQGATLSISYIGYLSKDVSASSETLRIVLSEDTQSLDELVVIGYQSVRKADLTGAVSVFKPETMKNTVVTGTVADALSTVPGLFVRSSGQPGAEGFVQIRGTSTFGTSNPLYVIDGIPITNFNASLINFGENMSSLATLSLNDVESITVLKDAASAAIYGSRATNGVVVITTKKGKEGKSRLDINLNSGVSEFANPNRVEFSNSELYLEVLNEGINNYNQQNEFQVGDVGYIVNQQNPFQGLPDTDWLGLISQRGVFTNLDLSFSGGNKKTNSISYIKKKTQISKN